MHSVWAFGAPAARAVASRVKRAGRHVLGERLVGQLDYLCRPELGVAWGGPFNGQEGRRAIFEALLGAVKPVAILETGTFRGTTTEYLARAAVPVHTVERLPRNYGFAKARLRTLRNVHVAHGDSRTELRRWVEADDAPYKGQAVVAYLDAHWNADMPLVEELDILFRNCPNAVAMVDDFQVPGDAGYGFDDYGEGRALTEEYVLPVMRNHRLAAFYPSLPSRQETGSQRGCVVLCGAATHGAALAEIPALRRGHETPCLRASL